MFLSCRKVRSFFKPERFQQINTQISAEFMQAVCDNDTKRINSFLLYDKLDLDHVKDGKTALELVIDQNNSEQVEKLLRAGADPNDMQSKNQIIRQKLVFYKAFNIQEYRRYKNSLVAQRVIQAYRDWSHGNKQDLSDIIKMTCVKSSQKSQNTDEEIQVSEVFNRLFTKKAKRSFEHSRKVKNQGCSCVCM